MYPKMRGKYSQSYTTPCPCPHTQIINSNENNKTAENKHDKIIQAPVPFLLAYFFL
jgi:hypothetical protein